MGKHPGTPPMDTPLRRSVALVVTMMMATMAVIVIFSPARSSSPQLSATTSLAAADTAQCTQDTGGTCLVSDCYPWRKHTTCSNFKCMCPDNMCAYQGSCVEPSQLPPPAPPVCEKKVGESCNFLDQCGDKGAVCTKPSFGFSTGFSLYECTCPGMTCAADGQCVDQAQPPPETLDAKKIVCPVLASLYNAGIFKPDAYGRVERLQIQRGIVDGLGADETTGWFFGITTAGFKEDDLDQTDFNMGNLQRALEVNKTGATEEMEPGDVRYLNIFKMLESPDVLHQVAAAVRGGPVDDPACGSPTHFPCLTRWERFFADHADDRGRIYSQQLGNIASYIYENGYHGVATKTSLFTITQGLTGREFLALAGWLACFGVPDENGDLYLSVEWGKTMEMNGVFPEGWVKNGPKDKGGNGRPLWGGADVLKTMNEWRLQGVKGLSSQMKAITALQSLEKGENPFTAMVPTTVR